MAEELQESVTPWTAGAPQDTRAVNPVLPLALFDYELSEGLIAQEPCPQRDQARLMVLQRKSGAIAHSRIADLPELLAPGDLLVLNNTRVLPARLLGRRLGTGGKWEGLFLRQNDAGLWEMLCQTRGRLRESEEVAIDDSALRLKLVAKTPEGHWLAQPSEAGAPESLLQQYGHVPLPPYIRKGRDQPADRERYQTVFAERSGAVAAPTAGLHFSPALLQRLSERGVRHTYVTLHVGIGTFQPIKVEDAAAHQMHREWGELPAATASAINDCRSRGGRVVAVGTTSVRVLETVAGTGLIRPWSGETALYIHPPYPFKIVDALLTNFHLPRSSLLVLVSAFAGLELVRRAYQVAVAEDYRFYSYGDAMLIV